MSALICFAVLYLIILAAGAMLHPLVTCMLAATKDENSSPNCGRFFYSWISLGCGTSTLLIVMSLIARIIPSYLIALPLSLAAMGAASYFATKQLSSKCNVASCFNHAAIGGVLVFLVVHLAAWSLRLSFSDIHFDPGAFGAEKLFNLSLQQSFLHGAGFPPESLWLAGEPEGYYILPRMIPGVASHFAFLLGITEGTGGILFHIGDSFYFALSTLVAAGTILFLLNRKTEPSLSKLVFQLPVALLPIISVPARAIVQSFSNSIDMWSLSRIIANTINEYPFWNFLWADNHAHSNSAFLQVLATFLGLLLILESPRWNASLRRTWGVLTAVSLAALYMSDSGATLAVLMILTPVGVASAAFALREKSLVTLFDAFEWSAAPTILLLLPDLLTRTQPHLTWSLVPSRLASPLLDYLNVFFVYSSFWVIAGGAIFFFAKGSNPNRRRLLASAIPSIIGLAIMTSGWPVIGLSLFVISIGSLVAYKIEGENSRRSIIALLGMFLLISFPEIVGANFDMGPDLIRFNTVFKFFFVSFYALPLLIAYAWGTSTTSLPKKVSFTLTGIAICSLLVCGYVQYKTYQNRVTRTHNQGDASGFGFLDSVRPTDASIIHFLAKLPGRIVIAEECGYPPKPASYSLAGRISAYSGHVGLCGWTMHSYIHHNVFRSGIRKGENVWTYFGGVDAAISAVLQVNDRSSAKEREEAKNALIKLQQLGTTHLIFGEWERELHPETRLTSLASLGGRVVFESMGMGVIDVTNVNRNPATTR